MDILRKININGVDYDISPKASKDQLGMIQLGSGLCITEDDEVSVNIGPGIKYSDDNKTLVIDADWIDNYIFENYGVSKGTDTSTTPKPATTTPKPATTTPEPTTTTTTPEPIITTQGVEGDIEWSIDSNGTLILSAVEGSSGIMKNYDRGSVNNSGDGADWMECGEKIENIIIEEGVTNIGDMAFGTNWGNTDNIKSVDIPDTVTSIGDRAFENCSGLTSVTIPNSVTSIGDDAFRDCSGLTNIQIPNSVTSIGSGAFDGCSGLTEITCLATTPPSLGNNYVFYNVPKSIPLYVPTESVDLYKNAEQWKEFNIQAIIEDTTTESNV